MIPAARPHYHSCGTAIHLRPLSLKVTFPLRASCTASFLHVTFSRALRTAIIAGRPNTKVFYDVAHPDRGRGIPEGSRATGHKKKAIRLSRRGKKGVTGGRKNRREGKRETTRATSGDGREEVSVIKLRGNPKFSIFSRFMQREITRRGHTRGLVFSTNSLQPQ